MRKNAQRVIAVGFLLLAFAFFLHSDKSTQAASTHNVKGYALSSNTGEINFSCDTDPNGCVVDYGVDIDATNTLTGQAWSSNLGWVTFDTAYLNNCPILPCTAKFNPTTGNLTGWARVCGGRDDVAINQTSINNTCLNTYNDRTDGSDMWISLSGVSPAYQAKLNTTTGGNGSGYAWGSDVVGWLDFSNAKYEPAPLSVPLVTTNSGVTSITSNSAVLPGGHSVNINGSADVPLTLTLEWGSSPTLASYGTLNCNGSPSNPTSVNATFSPFTGAIAGLTPSTTYYYRAVATKGANRYTGNILSFTTTTAIAPTVTLYANGVAGSSTVSSGSSQTLTWTGANLKVGNYCTISGSSSDGGSIAPSTVSYPAPAFGVGGWASTNPPTSSTSYSIWCFGTDGVTHSNTSTVTVNVTAQIVLCQVPALNAGSPPPCIYPAGICSDPNSLNEGQPLPCSYASGICEDPTSVNFGNPMPCKYRAKPKFIEF